MEKINLTIVIGTARDGRYSDKVAAEIERLLQDKEEVFVTLVDVKDFLFSKTVPSWVESEEALPWREIVRASDAFILVVPEYNRSYPGELKILLDSAYREYRKKAVGVVGVSSGSFAGARVYEHLQPVLTELGLAISPRALHVGLVEEMFTEDGAIKEEKKESFEENAVPFIESLLWYADTLRSGREKN